MIFEGDVIEQIHFKTHLHLKTGLSAKKTVRERYTCRANLEQAEQFRHDSYESPQSLKYWGLLIMQILRHGLNYEYLMFYFGEHIGKGILVSAVSPQIIPNILGTHQHNCKHTLDQTQTSGGD